MNRFWLVLFLNSISIKSNYIQIDDNANYQESISWEDDVWDSTNMGIKGRQWDTDWKKKRSNCEDLLMAAETGDLEKVQCLLDRTQSKEYVATHKFRGLDDFTALHFAAQENRVDVVKFLIEREANLDAKSSFGRTPLHLSSLKGHDKVVKLLVDNGADVNCQDEDTYTPLHYASEFGNIAWVEILINKGADISLKNNIGAVPSDICMNVDIRKLIQKVEEQSDSILEDTGSKRNVFHTVVLHNDRKSIVQKLMGKYQKVDRYLKDVKNGNEEALIRNIEEQQKQREEEKKRERGNHNFAPETTEKKKTKK